MKNGRQVPFHLHMVTLQPRETKTTSIDVGSPPAGIHVPDNVRPKVVIRNVHFWALEHRLEVTIENATDEVLEVPLAVQGRVLQ